MKQYIVTEEYLKNLIESEMLLIALEKAKVFDWPYYTNAITDFIIDCGKEDGVEYTTMTQIVDAEMEKLEPIEKGTIIL